MVVTEKKLKLEEKKVHVATTSEKVKMLTLKMDESDDKARIIVQAVHFEDVK